MTYNRADNLTKKGADANPNGRPKGAITRTTDIRRAIYNIFDNKENETLEDYLTKIKKDEPVEFMKIMAKLAPQKIESDTKHTIELSDADKLIIQRLTGQNND